MFSVRASDCLFNSVTTARYEYFLQITDYRKLARVDSWSSFSPGRRTQSDAANARSQSPRRVTTRSPTGIGVFGLCCGSTDWHITPQADTVRRSGSSSTYSTRSIGCNFCRTTSRARLYSSRMWALAALPVLVSDCSLDRLVCRSSRPPCSNWSGGSVDAAGSNETAMESTVSGSAKCEVIFAVKTAGCLNAYDVDSGRKQDAEKTGWKRTASWLSVPNTNKYTLQGWVSRVYVTSIW